MKNSVVLLWIMFSVAFMLIGFQVDWRTYISSFSLIDNPFEMIHSMYNTMVAKVPEFPVFDVKDAGDFFKYVGDFFHYLGAVIAVGAVLIVYVPFQFIAFCLNFALRVMGYGAIKPLNPASEVLFL